METNTGTWQERLGLTTCAASESDSSIPADAAGVAVIYEPGINGETIFLVIESRAGSLRSQCAKRLGTAKLPPRELLRVAFKAEPLPDPSRETADAVCRQQVIFAGELRRLLRPAMR